MSLIRFAFPLTSLAAGGVWMASGSSQAELAFDLPARDVVQRITASRTVEGTGMGSLTLSGYALNPREVRITVSRAGTTGRVKCTVRVAEESDTRSSAALDCTQTGAKTETLNRIGGEAMTIVVAEHVHASALKQPYDIDGVGDRMLDFMARNAPVMVAQRQPPGK